MIKGLQSLVPSSDFSVYPLLGASDCLPPRSSEFGIKKHLDIEQPDLYTQKWVELYRQGFNLENLKLSISLCNYPMGTWPSQRVCDFSGWHHYLLWYPNPRTGVIIFSSLSFTYSTSHIILSKTILLPHSVLLYLTVRPMRGKSVYRCIYISLVQILLIDRMCHTQFTDNHKIYNTLLKFHIASQVSQMF